MSNVIVSSNMNLPVPIVGTEPGPDWATDINACMSAIDSHDHSTGKGVQITPSGININTNLPFAGNNATTMRSVRFTSQTAPLATASDVGCIYESGVDLYYNDGNGNQVRITNGGSVTGAAGTITGLPSGTASASFAAGIFTFNSATSTRATMSVGPIVMTTSPATGSVTFQSSGSLAVDYTLTLPTAAPSNHQVPVSDGSGNLSWSWGLLPIGSVVATFPNLSGAYTTAATTVADAYGFVLCQGQTIADASSPMNGDVVPNISDSRFIMGSTTGGTTGGNASNQVTLSSANLASHTHNWSVTSAAVSGSTHQHNFAHDHQWSFVGNDLVLYGVTTSDSSRTVINNSSSTIYITGQTYSLGGSSLATSPFNTNLSLYTTGAIAAPSGSGATAATTTSATTTTVTGTNSSTGSGTAFSILPLYVTAVYVMRIK